MGARRGQIQFISAAALGLGMTTMTLGAAPFMDSEVPPQTILPVLDAPAGRSDLGLFPLPELNDSNASIIDALFGNRIAQNASNPLAVKVTSNLTTPAARSLFDKWQINYVIADYVSPDAVSRTKALTDLVKNSAKSAAALVGTFNLYAVQNDSTRPAAKPPATAARFQNVYSWNDFYVSASASLAVPSLLPGAPDFVTGTTPAQIRTNLFTMPIKRLSYTVPVMVGNRKVAPYVSRFYAQGNDALDTDHDPNKGTYSNYEYVSSASVPKDGTLLSRGDFSALMAHYRMRGSKSAILFAPGVVGYTKQEMQQDADAGWNLLPVDALLTLKNGIPVTKAIVQTVDDQNLDITSKGVVWSAVANDTELDLLISNLDYSLHEVDMPMVNGHLVLNDPGQSDGINDFNIEPGTHRLLQFNLVPQNGTQVWKLATNKKVFTDDNRNGIGIGDAITIPEPTTLALAGACGVCGLVNRRKRAA
ncbi:MAG TPA: PEP-CTERM sorting domain-containing protein [Tepidisphaeraceae bacterium]|jgi:hypothetical protein